MSSLALVRRLVVAAALAAAVPAVGCGSSSLAAREGTTARVVASPAEVEERASAGDEASLRLRAAEEESDRRARRIRELESRLAMRDAEVLDLQEEVDSQAADAARELASARRVRVQTEEREEGSEQVAERGSEQVAEVAAQPERDEPRVVLRLYGPPELPPVPTTVELGAGLPGAMRAPLYLPAPPPASMGRLPVLATSGGPVPPIPDQPLYVAPNPVPTPAPQADVSVREYQAALQLVTARRFEEADAALTEFLRAHPDHSYADNAMYWRAETLYARRDFAAAERALSEMVRRFPQGNKVPDALLRLGFCRQRQGDPEGARQYFRRVVAGYPGSVAARLASREDT